MYKDIETFITDLIDQSGSYDIARAEFNRILADDAELQAEYHQWCEDNGYAERSGFDEYVDRIRDDNDSVWDTLNDYDE